MKYFFTLAMLCCCFSTVLAQKYDHNWIHINPGQDNNPLDPPYPTEFLTFNTSPPAIVPFGSNLPGFGAEMILSDIEGNPLLYSNGFNIYHMDGSIMDNGDSLLPIILQPGYPLGGNNPPTIMALPRSGNNGDYYILQLYYENNWTYIPKIILSLVQGATASGLGIVTYKNKVLFEGHNVIDFFDVTRHANGRDWWIVFSDIDLEAHTRTYYSHCLMADTAYQAQSQVFMEYEPVPNKPWELYSFQKLFSPDGRYYINHDYIYGTRVHPFDRCTGELGAPSLIPFQLGSHGTAGWHAFSPNSRYLYTANGDYILQYDLTAQDIIGSLDTIGVYDGYLEPPAGIPTLFGYPQLGPDGKIYYFIIGQDWVHVIAEPNKKGAACHFMQRAFKMPIPAGTMPFFPNYRLGPKDNSSCDTLGINNNPLADFWWFSDSTLQVEFADNSSYEPAQWHWDFGDGGMSPDTSPVHVFPAAGTYHVCLTVSNPYASDTVCKDVTVGDMVPATEPVGSNRTALVCSPNPAHNNIQVQILGTVKGESQLEVFDALGKLRYATPLAEKSQNVEISTLAFSNGVYFCRLTQEGKIVSSAKFIVQH